MGVNVSTLNEYEAEADRVRRQIDETVKELRSRLTPSRLASEAAAGVGLTDVSWARALEFASKRHPVPTAIAGLGIACGRSWQSAIARGAAASPVSRRP